MKTFRPTTRMALPSTAPSRSAGVLAMLLVLCAARDSRAAGVTPRGTYDANDAAAPPASEFASGSQPALRRRARTVPSFLAELDAMSDRARRATCTKKPCFGSCASARTRVRQSVAAARRCYGGLIDLYLALSISVVLAPAKPAALRDTFAAIPRPFCSVLFACSHNSAHSHCMPLCGARALPSA